VDLSEEGVSDSMSLCRRLLEEAGVAITPGVDFEDPSNGLGLKRIRFSYSKGVEEVRDGMQRFKTWWLAHMKT
jgi:aspartate/methionine/tyrosine aminotransferase